MRALVVHRSSWWAVKPVAATPSPLARVHVVLAIRVQVLIAQALAAQVAIAALAVAHAAASLVDAQPFPAAE